MRRPGCGRLALGKFFKDLLIGKFERMISLPRRTHLGKDLRCLTPAYCPLSVNHDERDTRDALLLGLVDHGLDFVQKLVRLKEVHSLRRDVVNR